MDIDPIRSRRPVQARGAARAPGGAAFSVPDGTRAGTAATATAVEVASAPVLALQEAPPETVGDRPARRRGHDLLDQLAALQRDLLHPGGPGPAVLRRLARLADDIPAADTPALAEALAQIRLRAVVELARYRFDM